MTPTSSPSLSNTSNPMRIAAGTLLLLVAAVSSGLMSLNKLGALALPGCAIQSPCDAAARSKWGMLPGLDWPLAYLGFAYFAALLASWTASRGRWGVLSRLVATLGGVASLVLIGVMVKDHLLCPYCLAAHIANLVFVAMLWAGRGVARAGMGLAAIVGVFIVSSGALLVGDSMAQQSLKAREKAKLNASLAQAAGAQALPAKPATSPAPVSKAEPPKGTSTTTPPTTTPPTATAKPETQPFMGRYYWGAAEPKVRLVMFAGYQCPDCKVMEEKLQDLIKRRSEVMQLSIKHFPLCSMCNPHMQGQNPHPNGCWAARAAEAAGILGGNDAFQSMSYWLFSKGGAFSNPELGTAIDALGFDRKTFEDTMKSEETLKRVQADIEDGMTIGLTQTPMILLNGVELRGWRADPDGSIKAMENQINVMIATNRSNPNQRPAGAIDRFAGNWATGEKTMWGDRKVMYLVAPADSPVDIQVWGDLLDPGTAALDAKLRELVGDDNPQIRYQIRYFPVDQTCNPEAPRTVYAGSCQATRALEAAGRLGGPESYWKTLRWIFAHQKEFSIEKLEQAGAELGFNPALLRLTMDNPEIVKAVADEVDMGGRVKLSQIPQLYVNWRHVERWEGPDGASALPRIIEMAPRVAR